MTAIAIAATLACPVAAGADERPGFLLAVSVSQNAATLERATRIENYLPPKHAPSPEDWVLRIEDPSGRLLWSTPLVNPWHFAPLVSDDQRVPLSLRFPRLPGMARATVLDSYGRLALAIELDEEFHRRADAERELLLARVESNRRRVERWRRFSAGRKPGTARALTSPASLESLPEDLRRHLTSQLAQDHESLTRFGPAGAYLRSRHLLPATVLDQRRRRTVEERLARQSEPMPRAGAHTLSGIVRIGDTTTRLEGLEIQFHQYDEDYTYVGYLGSETTNASGRYSIAVDNGYVYLYAPTQVVAGQRYTSYGDFFQISGPTTHDFRVFPAVTLSGRVTSNAGGAVGGGWVQVSGTGNYYSVNSDSGGNYSLLVPGDVPLQVSVDAPSPFIDIDPVEHTFSGDTTLDFVLERGWLVSGRITDSTGAPVSGVTVVIRHINSTTSYGRRSSGYTDDDGQYQATVRKHLEPPTFVALASKNPFVRQARGLHVTSDTTADFVLREGVLVSGTVRDPVGDGVNPASVFAYQGDELVTSVRTLADGSYALSLAPGVYTLRAESWEPYGTPTVAPVEIGPLDVQSPQAVDFTLPQPAAMAEIRLRYPSAGAVHHSQQTRFEVLRNGRLVQTARAGDTSWDGTHYWLSRMLYLDPGTYDVRVLGLGFEPFVLKNVTAASPGQVVVHHMPEAYRWSGIVRDAFGQPLSLSALSYDDMDLGRAWAGSALDGSFEFPISPGGFVRFWPPPDGNGMPYIERLGDVGESRSQDLTIEEFPSFTDTGVLTQMFGVADRINRYNIVVLGDGYTDTVETFTDVNANGIWDGVLHYDFNGNGIWDGWPERVAVYGERDYPTQGTDPTIGNEPFGDLNGDAFPNLDDQAIFDKNALDVIRSLFGQDFWIDNRHALNVFRLRIVSNQAGHDIWDENNDPILERDTALSSRAGTPQRGYILSADYGLIQDAVNQHVPEWDAVIVMINQPILMGRATSLIIMNGGPLAAPSDSRTITHEMGHKVGHLADEYTEFAEVYTGPEPISRNVTTMTHRDRIPWRGLIATDKEIPSIQPSAGVGLFEGGYYRIGGVYRPAYSCMMAYSERHCPVCLRELTYRVEALLGGPSTKPTPISPVDYAWSRQPALEWVPVAGASHYEIELRRAGQSAQLELDVYRHSSYQLASQLLAERDYEWRVRGGGETNWGPWSSWTPFTTPNDGFADGFESGDTSAWTVP